MPARFMPTSTTRTRQSGVPLRPHNPPSSRSQKRDPSPAVKTRPVQKPQLVQNRVTVHNRVGVLLVHIPRLSIRGQARLADEAGVSRSTISRLVNGRINPSYRLARTVTSVLERLLGRPLDMRDVFSTDGTYLEPSGCKLCLCSGCLPERAWDEDGTLKPAWRDARPGDWSLARPADCSLQEPTRSDSPKGEKTETGGTEADGKEDK